MLRQNTFLRFWSDFLIMEKTDERSSRPTAKDNEQILEKWELTE